ncbi:hypothetical protein ABGB12_24740 [Actinocorallia sp. B10E7]|uniref:hypothetical protein n=1 Tax=Actinocorallia sp. B10E7 TaxID=3153558 RepID=UPI00325E800B
MLSYDMVFVPDPPATAAMFGRTGGFPRQVPSDAFAAALSFLPHSQQLILLSVFVLAAWGVGRLVPGGLPAKLAAVVVYLWNPYLAERLLLGHWALLLGYAGLPWVLDAVLRRRRASVLAASLLPAAVGGFAAMNVTALVLAGGLAAVRGRGALRVLLVFPAMALPWLVPALLNASDTRTDPGGVDLFAARADTPFGTLGSLLSLGGIWNAETVPPGYTAPLPAFLRLLLCLAALAALALHRSPAARAALYSGTAGLALACLGATAPGRALLRSLVEFWPGFGALRDGQLYLAPLALAVALGLSLLAARPAPREDPSPSRPREELRRRRDGWGLTWVAAVPVLLLPTLAWGISARLQAVDYPAEWRAAQRLINADPVGGDLLSLPWGAYRRPEWNGGRAVLDPWPRLAARRVVWDDGLRVGGRSLAQEDPWAADTDALLRAGGELAPKLAASGFRYVVISRDHSEQAWTSRLHGAERVIEGPTLIVYRLGHSG